MTNVTGYSWIDGIDLWTSFGMFFEKASTEFLRYAPKKEGIKHDWMDSDGVDYDLSRFFFQERQGTLNCAIVADNEADFWEKHNAFIALMAQPGKRRLELKAHVNMSYFVFYKECNSYTQVQAIKGNDETIFGPNRVSAKFSIVIVEPEPRLNASNVFLVEEEGRFLIT